MHEVNFEEEYVSSTPFTATTREEKEGEFVSFLIKRGWARDKKHAEKILLAIIAIALIVTIAFMWPKGESFPTPPQPGDWDQPGGQMDFIRE